MVKSKDSAIIYYTNGTSKDLGHKPTLDEAQEIVGGWIELVHRTVGNPTFTGQMIVNEEGLMRGLPINKKGTEIYAMPDYFIVGNIIVLEGKYKLD